MDIDQTGVAREMAPNIACPKCRWIPIGSKVPRVGGWEKEFLYAALPLSLMMMIQSCHKIRGPANTLCMDTMVDLELVARFRWVDNNNVNANRNQSQS